MARIFQEFYCTISGGGCGGYIVVPLHDKLTGVVDVICPKCGHKHQRYVKNGRVKEDGRWTKKPVEEICPTMASYREKPLTTERQRRGSERDGKVIKKDEDSIARSMLDESWFERFAGKVSS